MLKPFLFLSATALLSMAVATAPGNPAQAPAKGGAKPAAAAAAPVETLAKAKKLYNMDCAICHGDNGNGQTDLAKSMELKLDDWTDAKALADKQDSDLIKLIRNGKDKMPPEDAGRAKDDEVKELVVYIRNFSKGQQAAAAAASAPQQ
jgi:mono/diheme cytochrome c family protein